MNVIAKTIGKAFRQPTLAEVVFDKMSGNNKAAIVVTAIAASAYVVGKVYSSTCGAYAARQSAKAMKNINIPAMDVDARKECEEENK